MLTREMTLRHSVGTGSDDRHHAWNSSQLPAERMIVRLKPVVTSGDFKKGETLSVSKKKRGEDVRMAVDADGTGEIRDVVEYRVDRAFGPRSGDTEVYEAAAAGLVDRALRGGNGLLLLAGTPRSDGCLTMWKPAAPPRTTLEGILPSALSDLTRRWRGGQQSNLPRQRLAKGKMRVNTTTEAFPNSVMRLCVAEIWGGVDGGTRDLLKDSGADDCNGRDPDALFSPKEVVAASHARRLEERSSGDISDGRLSPGGDMGGRDEAVATPKGSAETKTATTALLTAGVLVGVTEATVDGLDRALSLIGECQERRTKDRRGHLVVAVKLVVPTAANEMATTMRPATGEVVFVEMGDCPGGDLPRNLLAALQHLKISKHPGTKGDRTSESPSDDPLRALFGCLASGGLWVSPTRRSRRDLLRTAGVPLEVSVMATLDSGSGFREEKIAVLEALARSTRTRPKSCPSFKKILESIPMFACGSRTLSVDAVPSSVTPPTALSSKDSVRSFVRSLSSSASVSTCPLMVEASQDSHEGNGHCHPYPHPHPHPDRSDGSSELSVTAMEVVKVEGATERGVDCSVEDVGGQDGEAVRVGSDSAGLGEEHAGRSEGGLSDEGERGGIVPEMTLRIVTEEAKEERDKRPWCIDNGEFDNVGGVGLAIGQHEGDEEMALNSCGGALTTPRHLECSEPEADGIEELMDKEQSETPGPDCGRPMLRLLLLPADELARRVLQAEEASNYWKTQHALAEQELAKLRVRLGPDKYGVSVGELGGSPGYESVERVVVQGGKSRRGMRLAHAAFGNRCASLPMEIVSGGIIDCGGILRGSVGGETETIVTPSRLTFEERRALFCVKERRASARSSVVARPRRSTSSLLPNESKVSLGVEGAGVRKGFNRRSLSPNRVTDCVVPAETKRSAAVAPSASPGDNFADRVNSGTPASDGRQTFSDLSVDRPPENHALLYLQMTSDSESVSMAVDEASSAPVTTAADTDAIPRECSSAANPTRPASSGSCHLLTAAEMPPVVLTSKGNEGSSELPDLDSPCSSFFSPPLLSPPFFPKPIAQGLAMRTGAATFERKSSFRRPLSSWYGIQKRRDRSGMRPDEERRSRTWSVDHGANARRGLASALRMASLSRSLSSEVSSMSPASSSGATAAVSSSGAAAAFSSSGGAAAFSSSSSSSASSSSPESSSVFYGGQSRLPDNIMSPDSAAAAAAAAGALEMTASLASGITTRECAEFFWGGDTLRPRGSQEGSPEAGWKKSLISFTFPKVSSSVPEPRVSPDSRTDGKI